MVECLEVGMKIRARYGDEFYSAEVVEISTAEEHAAAPVKVHYAGYETSDDAWMPLVELRSKHLPKASALRQTVKSRTTSGWDYSGLEIGMRVRVESDGKYCAAEVVALSEDPRRKHAPVKVHWVGYTSESVEWVGGDRLRSKALKSASDPRRQTQEKKLRLKRSARGGITAVTWNISAINNNPFEYWITHTDKRYAELMEAFEQAVDKPELPINDAEVDVLVSEVLTEALYGELRTLMATEGWSGLEVVDQMWHEDFSKRKIVSGFLKDKTLGLKRLASMPDRMTNTISVATSSEPVCRPAVTNNFQGSLGSVTEWWTCWKDFMFCVELSISAKGQVQSKRPCELLGKISREKYPAVAEEEEAVSLPLQVLCLAIFDAILVRLMNLIMPNGAWLPIKQSIAEAIFSKKTRNTLRILKSVYADVDVICLQECALDFGNDDIILDRYHKVAPSDADTNRAQNSLLLLRKKTFPEATSVDLTSQALDGLEGVAMGDLVLVRTRTAAGKDFLLGSFHGDTNGLKSKPVVSAVASVLEKQEVKCHLIFGLDANTYLKKEEGWQGVDDFLAHCSSLDLRSCWPEDKNMTECCTTCHARTFLQSQLNKAIRRAELLTEGDVSPKDHILVSGDYDVAACHKDNTGRLSYLEQTPFPSLDFPSDHALVSIVLEPRTWVAT
mmetsp:Transcript_136771/g.272792  ORF Transcript_136771/g.272792 Transcript_136771/m.272792 type:complete len:672 (+) Transcript_136771:92-2107(+)|eukprot:CAMPEP_0172679050 /NCGR_PEP_ID=MMETSP1074-20121228/15803_1 /TAXON_ID=2916 /ORGANISM="Ceratium fusus, Strain PA161109" /LENGTH=671 /DNA_ID=CAMNT_0013497169 /DNA_START=370 /DNA_END=2385 /DNA_ORIENTATION=+